MPILEQRKPQVSYSSLRGDGANLAKEPSIIIRRGVFNLYMILLPFSEFFFEKSSKKFFEEIIDTYEKCFYIGTPTAV